MALPQVEAAGGTKDVHSPGQVAEGARRRLNTRLEYDPAHLAQTQQVVLRYRTAPEPAYSGAWKRAPPAAEIVHDGAAIIPAVCGHGRAKPPADAAQLRRIAESQIWEYEAPIL